MFKKTNAHQSKLFAGLSGVAALALLTACTADGPAEEPPADQEVEEQSVESDDAQQETTDDTADQTEETTDDAQAAGDDEVFSIIDAVETEYEGGFIVEIDREDGGSKYEVVIVVGDEVYELDVTSNGDISVDEQDNDAEKIARADQATVTVTEALKQAFEQHPDATFDDADLDEDDGSLDWEIELDGADGSDIELDIPAT